MHTGAVAREKLFNMRLSEEEAARLERLAAHYGLNAAGVIRMLLKREEDALAGKVLPGDTPRSYIARRLRQAIAEKQKEGQKPARTRRRKGGK